ncbi:hypothetical protein [Salinibius halmophilus]|uniref:hypothetical protein n=1 Tax=Salinibius halmophilus TaxID=1853216 RepID=UPI000E66C411|nr:hypothetical protein [Salinibius halmophilus]
MAKKFSELEAGASQAAAEKDQKIFWRAFINGKFCFSKASWRALQRGELKSLEISEIVENSVNLILFNRALGGHLVKLLPSDVTLKIKTANGQITIPPHTISQLKRCVYQDQQLLQSQPIADNNQLGIA